MLTDKDVMMFFKEVFVSCFFTGRPIFFNTTAEPNTQSKVDRS